MKISPINNTNQSTNFNAKIIPTKEWNHYMNFIEKNAVARIGYSDTIKDKAIIERFITAVANNPSDARIKLNVSYRKDEDVNARGVISSQYGKFPDVEPARSDSKVKIENILRRILDPENRLQMCKLFGADKNAYDVVKQNEWWNEYISPIWRDIMTTFYEPTGGRPVKYDRIIDKCYNEEFRKQNPVL